MSPERCDWGTGTIIGLRAVRGENRKRWVSVRPVSPSPRFRCTVVVPTARGATFATNTRAREEQADTLAAKIMTVVDGVEPEPGKVSKARLQFDAYRWHVGKLAPKKYGDRIEHDIKGGVHFQPQILIPCSSSREEPQVKIATHHEPSELQ